MNEAPIDETGTPQVQHLYAVFDSEQDASEAVSALARAGRAAERLRGDEIARRLRRPEGSGGLAASVGRLAKTMGGEDHEAERYAIHLEHGRTILAVPCADRGSAEHVTRALVQHGAYDVTFFGNWTIEHMSPGENSDRGMPTYEASTSADDLEYGEVPPNPSRH